MRIRSYRKGILRSTICRRLQVQGRQGEAEAGYASGAGHDDAYDYAHAAPRG